MKKTNMATIWEIDRMIDKVEKGEVSIKEALSAAYDNGVRDLEKISVDKAKNDAIVIHDCAARLITEEKAAVLKDGVINVLTRPYTQDEIKAHMNENCYVTGNVAVPLSEIIDNDFEAFLDLLAIKLVDDDCLMDISYKAVGIQNVESGNADIIIEVSGDVSEILVEDDDDDDQETMSPELLESMVQELKEAAVRMGDEVISDILGHDYDKDDDVESLLDEVFDQMPDKEIERLHITYCNSDMKRGYAIVDFDGMGLFEVQRIDLAGIFKTDDEATEQAIKDGVKVIPVEELPEEFERRYLGWIDTPENRKAIEEFCRKDG